MTTKKLTCLIVGTVVCLLILTVGCSFPAKTAKTNPEPQGQAATVQLALKFSPQDVTTCKVTTEISRTVDWHGPLPEKPGNIIGGQTSNRVEMTYTQRINSVDDQGSAIAEIGIEAVKYFAKVRDITVLDFDSSKAENPKDPMALLVGQRYTIKIAPTGRVVEVIDVNEAQKAVQSGSGSASTALALLSEDAIKQRHSIVALPAADKSQAHLGDNWSEKETLSFGMMGSRSYEMIYTLKEVKNINGQKIAVVQMNAVPSSGEAKENSQQQALGLFSKMFDNIETYTGELQLNLGSGKVEQYVQQLRTEWVVVDPAAPADQKPAVLKMVATRLHRIEKVGE